MNRRWCNNEIICTVLWINQRYFSSKKDSVEIFNAYMQKVNLKFYNFLFILLMFLFRAWCMHRKFQLQDLWSCALAWWCQKHHLTSHTHTHTHTSYFLTTSLTTFLFTQPSIHTWHRHEPRTTYICRVLFQYTNMRYIFQYVFHDGKSRISTLYFLTPSRKE
jgi:hypothetical protein